MAAAHSPISLEEYMRTSYSPDCDYIDGMVVERNVGQGKHSYTQTTIILRIAAALAGKGLLVLAEQRTRVSGPRVRIPDVCVVSELEEVTNKPPLLCVEVLSADDRWNRVNNLLSDYQEMGVPCVWVIDPYSSRAWIYDLVLPPVEIASDGMLRAEALGLEIRLSEVLPPAAS